DRRPSERLQFQQDVADSAGFVIAGRTMVRVLEDQLFVLRADTPGRARFFAGLHRLHELLAPLDPLFIPRGRLARAHRAPLATTRGRRQRENACGTITSPPPCPSTGLWRR